MGNVEGFAKRRNNEYVVLKYEILKNLKTNENGLKTG